MIALRSKHKGRHDHWTGDRGRPFLLPFGATIGSILTDKTTKPMTDSNHILYTDRDRQWYFLVPAGAALSDGDFDVYTLGGKVRHVDPYAIQPHQVTRQAAEAWLKARLRDQHESLVGSATDFEGERQSLDEYIGLSDDNTQNRSMRQQWEAVFQQATALVDDASDNADRTARAKAVAAQIAATLRAKQERESGESE